MNRRQKRAAQAMLRKGEEYVERSRYTMNAKQELRMFKPKRPKGSRKGSPK